VVTLLAIGEIGLLITKGTVADIGSEASNFSRGLITILVAIVTVAIAIILTLFVTLRNAPDLSGAFYPRERSVNDFDRCFRHNCRLLFRVGANR
jgi:hypothetical protein